MANDLTRSIMANLTAGRSSAPPRRQGGGPLFPREEELLTGLIGGAEEETHVHMTEVKGKEDRPPAAGQRGISLSELARRQGRGR